MWARQLAWLHARPRPYVRSDAKPGKARPAEQLPIRMQKYTDEGTEPPIPELYAAQHLARHLFDVGPVMSGGMGSAPITYSEITAWQRACSVPLTPWEAQTLRAMSMAYAGESVAAEAHDAPPPYIKKRSEQHA